MASHYLAHYAAQYGGQSFAQQPFNEVDGLICAVLSYMDFSRLYATPYHRLGDLALDPAIQQQMTAHTYVPAHYLALLRLLTASPRFRDVQWHQCREQFDAAAAQQFAAMTLELAPQQYYIAFRGTNSTIAGWKEDLNMSYLPVVPSQRAAVRYLHDIQSAFPGQYYLGGHSKGGNLAVYAALHSTPAAREDIVRIFNFDGPGFLPDPEMEERYVLLAPRITKLVPQASIFGMLLEPHQDFSVVDSDGFTLWQHDPFTWQVRGRHFVRRPKTDFLSQYTQEAITQWLQSIPREERGAVLASLYTVVDATTLGPPMICSQSGTCGSSIMPSKLYRRQPASSGGRQRRVYGMPCGRNSRSLFINIINFQSEPQGSGFFYRLMAEKFLFIGLFKYFSKIVLQFSRFPSTILINTY